SAAGHRVAHPRDGAMRQSTEPRDIRRIRPGHAHCSFEQFVPAERLDPRLDLVFKALLTREQTLLRSMLEAVLDTPVGSFELLNPEIPGDLTSDKAIVLDVRVLLSTG